ncbi:trypsin-like peptidase domain-containing protein [Nonomuraea sp. NPDC048892]|uniref:S1C family serine protease n=1 Tax=Nonomuraea sp. NPDC048892 TaxID=3154624 RepID=UPI0033E038FE
MGNPQGPDFLSPAPGARPEPDDAPPTRRGAFGGPPPARLEPPAGGPPPVSPPPVLPPLIGPPPRPVPAVSVPGTDGGRSAPESPRGRLLVAAGLVAALTGALGGAAVATAGAGLFEGPAPAPVAALPRAAPVPSAGLTGLSATAARVLPSVVQIETRSSGGSGFAVDERGHILTNAHVVRGSSQVTVVLSDGSRLPARVAGADDGEDLAVLELDDPSRLTPATLGRSSDLSVGEQVLAIGSPLGLSGTVTAGIVSALDREVRLGGFSRTAVQTDASINPGNSGGPLVNGRGEVVGVNTAIASGRGGGNIGIGFAIPIDRAAPIADRIIRN